MDNIEDCYSIIKSRPKPLAAYLFTNNEQLKKDYVDKISSGGILINDAILHVVILFLKFTDEKLSFAIIISFNYHHIFLIIRLFPFSAPHIEGKRKVPSLYLTSFIDIHKIIELSFRKFLMVGWYKLLESISDESHWFHHSGTNNPLKCFFGILIIKFLSYTVIFMIEDEHALEASISFNIFARSELNLIFVLKYEVTYVKLWFIDSNNTRTQNETKI